MQNNGRFRVFEVRIGENTRIDPDPKHCLKKSCRAALFLKAHDLPILFGAAPATATATNKKTFLVFHIRVQT